MNKLKYRSPLRDLPALPTPGTSGRIQMLDILVKKLGGIFLIWVYLFSMTITTWSQHLTDWEPRPWMSLFLFLCATAYLVYVYHVTNDDLKKRSEGMRGEIVVGNYLEGLRRFGYTPIHDVPCVGNNGKSFNIDHVLIGPTGIFVVETKTISIVIGKDEKITYKNGLLYFGADRYDGECIHQARRNAEWLQKLLADRMGTSIKVDSILTFPGWFVKKEATQTVMCEKDPKVYVLSTKAMGGYLGPFQRILTDEQIDQVVKSLSDYIYKQADKQLT